VFFRKIVIVLYLPTCYGFKACNAYYLPIRVSPHVEIVTPSLYFDTVLKRRGSTSLPAKKVGLPGAGYTPKTTGKIKTLFKDINDCDKIITPLCLRALYGFFYRPSASDRNTFGIGGLYLLSVNQSIVI
jgi:tripeptidyl-peptidase-1